MLLCFEGTGVGNRFRSETLGSSRTTVPFEDEPSGTSYVVMLVLFSVHYICFSYLPESMPRFGSRGSGTVEQAVGGGNL